MDHPEEAQWYVMRDLKRTNAKLPAYKFLMNKGIEVFVPMQWKIFVQQGQRMRLQVPFIQDLLFVLDTRSHLDPIVEIQPTLQYRWLRNTYREPMTVPKAEMERFIQAVRTTDSPKYYLSEEITPQMYGKKIRIIGGNLNGFEGYLLTTRGSKVKRLLVELKGCLAAGVEVNPEFIEFV